MNRRQFLGIAGAAAGSGLAGCVGSGRFALPGNARPNLDAGASSWATFGADPANTGHAPDASGPTADAAVVWEFDAGSAAAASPVVVGDAVFAAGSGGLLHALDAATGDPYWEFEARGRVASAPAVADGAVYAGTDDRRLHAVDARTGDERWTTDLGRDLGGSSLTVTDGTIYLGAASEHPETATDGHGDQRAGGALVALDAATGEECWSFEDGGRVATTPAVVGGRVYFGDDAGYVRALDAQTGAHAWSFAAGSRVTSSPAVADGVVYFGGRGLLFALDDDTGDPNWTFDLRWPTVTCSPAVADGAVYVGCHGRGGCGLPLDDDACDLPETAAARLCAVDGDYGAEKWSFDLAGDVLSSPAVADGAVYLGRADGVSAVDAGDGAEAWRVELGAAVDSSPAVAGGRVFVTCADGRVCALGK